MLEVKIPSVAESITEVTLSQWLVKDGDIVTLDQPICELETDKASQELYAEASGQIKLEVAEGEDIAVGALIAKIDTSKAAEAPKKAEKAVETPKVEKVEATPVNEEKTVETTSYAAGTPSPAAAKLISENNLSPSQIKSSGKGGRITKADVLNAISQGANFQQSVSQLAKQADFSRAENSEKMSRLRKTISERLVFAKNETAMLTTFNEVDMKPVMDIRNKYKDDFYKKFGVGLGFMSFFTKACAHALIKFPAVNAYIDVEKSLITYHDYADISIAVSTPKGLVVPVIRNAESLSMNQIEATVKELAIKGRDGKLSVDEMSGGTFTITNGGVFGSLLSTPIINTPQSAILGMHKIEDRPVAIDGKVEIRPMMYLALSYDHRIIDGKESVSFLVAVKDMLEHPEKLLLGEDPIELLLQL